MADPAVQYRAERSNRFTRGRGCYRPEERNRSPKPHACFRLLRKSPGSHLAYIGESKIESPMEKKREIIGDATALLRAFLSASFGRKNGDLVTDDFSMAVQNWIFSDSVWKHIERIAREWSLNLDPSLGHYCEKSALFAWSEKEESDCEAKPGFRIFVDVGGTTSRDFTRKAGNVGKCERQELGKINELTNQQLIIFQFRKVWLRSIGFLIAWSGYC